MSEVAAAWVTGVVFAATYFGLALGRLPGLRTDRTGIALAGAAAVLATGVLAFDEAVRAVDFATLVAAAGHDDRRRLPAPRRASSSSWPAGPWRA